MEAIDGNVPEAIMLNGDGNVAECTADNIFLARNNVVYTPTTYDGILEGVTRDTIMQLCGKLGITCLEKTLTRTFDLYLGGRAQHHPHGNSRRGRAGDEDR